MNGHARTHTPSPKHKQVRQYKKKKKLVPVRYLHKGLKISGKINTDAKLDGDKWLKSAHLLKDLGKSGTPNR